MKTKITLLIAGCVFALASIMFTGEDVATESDLMSKNIEALSQGGEFDGFQQGYTSDTKKKIVSSSFQSTIWGGFWYYEYEEVPCCRVSNPGSACNVAAIGIC